MPPQGSRIDPMQLMMSLMQMKQQGEYQQAQLADAAEGRKQQAWATLENLAGRTADPTKRAGLAKLFAPQLGVDVLELTTELANWEPDSDVLPTWAAGQEMRGDPTSNRATTLRTAAGDRIFGGLSSGEFAESSAKADAFSQATPTQRKLFGDMKLTGMTPGQQADDALLAATPSAERARMFRIKGGTEMSVGDAAQNTIAEGNLRLGQRQLSSQDALGWASLGLDGQKIANAYTLAGKSGNGKFGEYLNKVVDIQQELTKNRVNLGRPEIIQRLHLLKNLHKLMNQEMPEANMPDIDPEKAIKEIYSPGGGSRFGAYIKDKIRQ